MGSGRQGHREKEARGSNIGILFRRQIPMNQHQPRQMHVYLKQKGNFKKKKFIVLNAGANLDTQSVTIKGS